MNTSDLRVKLQNIRDLKRLGKDALPPLQEALTDENVAIVRTALLTLGQINQQGVGAVILPFLEHQNLWVRRAAVQALGDTGEAMHTPHLVERLDDPELYELAHEALIKLKVDPDFF